MYIMMTVIALASGITPGNLLGKPAWNDDYAQALKKVADLKKPMAVFVGSGKDGWGKVLQDGAIKPEVYKLLAAQFVCLYVDTDTVTGKAIAAQFQVAARGLIISDRTGTSQAYSLSGSLSATELTETLTKYSEKDRDVQTTTTVVREAPVGVRPAYAPQYQFRSGST